MSKALTFKFDRTGALSPAARTAGARALEDISEDCLREANVTVPIEEGDLARSGTASSDPGTMRAAVGYDTKYAVRQHEDPTLRHNDNRRDHWLERTFEENQARYQDHLADALRKALS